MKRRYIILPIVTIAVVVVVFGNWRKAAAGERPQVSRNPFLEDKFYAISRTFNGDSSYMVKDLKTGDVVASWDPDSAYPAASMIKLPIVAVVFMAVQDGNISLEEELAIERRDIAGGSGELKTMALPRRVSVNDLLNLMIVSSDNTATNKIVSTLGMDYINAGFNRLGLKATVMNRKMMDFSQRGQGVDNFTSVADIVYLLEKIYKGELLSRQASEAMLAFLKAQKINDRIPRYLPQDLEIAHKTGLERGIVHDAGIVFRPDGDFIICVFTKGAKSFREAKRFIARLSLCAFAELRGTAG